MNNRIYRLRATTPLHMGMGQGAGDIDQPIAREKSTGLPLAPGSAVKGVLRDAMDPGGDGPHKSQTDVEWAVLFGPAYSDNVAQAGMLIFEDARLLAMPVRSLKGTCAWVTCPFVLARYTEALRAANAAPPDLPSEPLTVADGKIAATSAVLHNNTAILEELDLAPDSASLAARDTWAGHLATSFMPDATHAGGLRGASATFRDMFKARVAIVSDETFAFFAETATEVRARIRLGEDRVVARNALWYEELLPAESLFWGEWGAQRVRMSTIPPDAACALVKSQPLQLGGKATVGYGRMDFLV